MHHLNTYILIGRCHTEQEYTCTLEYAYQRGNQSYTKLIMNLYIQYKLVWVINSMDTSYYIIWFYNEDIWYITQLETV